MNFLCPSCRTPLPRAAPEHVTCSGCGVAVDLTRVDTAPGQARLWPEIDLSGETLSGYSLLKLLGSGGMGSVYEARGADGVIVALKVLSPLLAAEPALRERFRREARALATISHPGVVKMLGEGEENSFCWYAMERVVGTDLRERLKSGPLSVDEVRELAKVMLDALEVVHAAGFVHRDVKPSNILLASTGPKLCDFGIARLEGASTLTESAALLGSLRYMAPEQRWGKSDARSDLYALGVVMHEALALGVPGEKTLPPSTPASLMRFIAKLTETSAVLRPQSAEAAKRLLLPSSKRPALFALAAMIPLIAAAVYLAIPTPNQTVAPLAVIAPAVLDAGLAELVEPDAGLLAQSVPDASVEPGPVFAKISPDGGNLVAVFRGIGTTGTDSIRPIGTKPTKKPTPSPTGKMKKPISKLELEPPQQGELEVAGSGPATVFDGKRTLGAAPGKFTIPYGGHGIFVVCQNGGTRRGFKVSLTAGTPREVITYSCPES